MRQYVRIQGKQGSAVMLWCGKYRYLLRREFPETGLPQGLCVIMLNPSTADAEGDDPTIRCLTARAKALRYGWLEVVNLFAFRSPSPRAMMGAFDPVGPDNDFHIVEATERAEAVLLAWGTRGEFMARDQDVLDLLAGVPDVYCLGRTKHGHPRHPLYVPAAQAFEEWSCR